MHVYWIQNALMNALGNANYLFKSVFNISVPGNYLFKSVFIISVPGPSDDVCLCPEKAEMFKHCFNMPLSLRFFWLGVTLKITPLQLVSCFTFLFTPTYLIQKVKYESLLNIIVSTICLSLFLRKWEIRIRSLIIDVHHFCNSQEIYIILPTDFKPAIYKYECHLGGQKFTFEK